MAVLMDILSGVLSGGLLADAVSHFGVSHFFIVVKPEAFLGEGEFDDPDESARRLHPRLAGGSRGKARVILPGEPELDHEADSNEHGLELDIVIWQGLAEAAEAYGQQQALLAAKR